jgi:hypothetical protein
MRAVTIWTIRIALTVQFLGVLAVPALVASNDAPRAMWMAEWMRPDVSERAIGVLKLRDNKITFVEQLGQADWEIDLSSVKRVSTTNGGRAAAIETAAGQLFVVGVMDATMLPDSPKKVVTTIERALQAQAAVSR